LRASAASPEGLHKVIGAAVEVLIGRTYENAGTVEWDLQNKHNHGSYLEMSGLLKNKTYGEELPVTWLYPKKWNGRAIVWLDDAGKSAIHNADGSVKPAVLKLVESGATVVGADLLYQGDFLKDGKPLAQTPKVANPREFAGFTFGYNHAVFAQ